jgi:hypothetical protein
LCKCGHHCNEHGIYGDENCDECDCMEFVNIPETCETCFYGRACTDSNEIQCLNTTEKFEDLVPGVGYVRKCRTQTCGDWMVKDD